MPALALLPLAVFHSLFRLQAFARFVVVDLAAEKKHSESQQCPLCFHTCSVTSPSGCAFVRPWALTQKTLTENSHSSAQLFAHLPCAHLRVTGGHCAASGHLLARADRCHRGAAADEWECGGRGGLSADRGPVGVVNNDHLRLAASEG